MSKADKLLESLLRGAADHNFTFDDAAYLLQKLGAKVRPGKGSHTCFVLDGKLFNLQKKGGKAKAYQIAQIRDYVKTKRGL